MKFSEVFLMDDLLKKRLELLSVVRHRGQIRSLVLQISQSAWDSRSAGSGIFCKSEGWLRSLSGRPLCLIQRLICYFPVQSIGSIFTC